MVMGILKPDASYGGYLMWHNPTYTGYRASTSASITDGSDFRNIVFMNAANGATWEEGFTQNYETNLTTYGSYLNPLVSAGLMPTIQFIISGSLTLLTQKFKIGVVSPVDFKAVSAEIDGVELTNSTALSLGVGNIRKYNSKYYIPGNYVNDGDNLQRVLFELGT